MAQGVYSIIEDAAIVTSGALIEWIGPRNQLPSGEYPAVNDLQGAWVTPGLIDCHTHTVFGGNRSGEFEKRLQGVSYAEIAASGGGIASTVRATREATEDELFASAAKRLKSLMRDGVTTVEMKSGYGLDLANERKILRVIRRLEKELPISVRSTCLAAHALPPEYKDRADDYIELICTEMLPALAAEGLVDAVDAFCEYLAFSPEQVERVFIAAQKLGLPVKLHAEQLSSLHGSSLAARYKALSADHLEFMDEADAIAMAESDTVVAADVEHGLHLFPHDPGRSPGRCDDSCRASAGHGRHPRLAGSRQGCGFRCLAYRSSGGSGLLAGWRSGQTRRASRRRIKSVGERLWIRF
jgi:imidazolonepropionase